MQKLSLLSAITAVVVVFSYCSSTKKAPASTAPAAPAVAATTYEGNIKSIIVTNCAPCHTQGGRLEAYDNYANAKKEIAEIIERVERAPGEKGFMPRNKPKLDENTIALLKKWQANGMTEQ